jgi:hypothetical protein
MADNGEKLEGLLDERYRPSFRLMVGMGVGVGVLTFLISQAEAFVEARIDKRVLAGNALVEIQTKRLEKVEYRVDEVREAVMEIRADVRTLRESRNVPPPPAIRKAE